MFLIHCVLKGTTSLYPEAVAVKSVEDPSAKLKPVKMDDFFKLDYRTGSLTNQLTNERMEVFPVIQWAKLKERLTKEIDEYAPLALAIIGSMLGSAFVGELMDEIGEPEILMKHLADLAAASGWGVISMTGDVRYGSKYVVAVANCVFCEGAELASNPRCNFVEGILKGIADSVFGTPHKVREERCAAAGEALCQFVVEEAWPESEPGMGANDVDLREWGVKNVEDLERSFTMGENANTRP